MAFQMKRLSDLWALTELAYIGSNAVVLTQQSYLAPCGIDVNKLFGGKGSHKGSAPLPVLIFTCPRRDGQVELAWVAWLSTNGSPISALTLLIVKSLF